MTRLAVRSCQLVAVVAILSPVAANAAYVISVVDADTGSSVATAYPGETIELALLMTGTGRFDAFGVWMEAAPDVLEFGEWVPDPIFSGLCKFDACRGPYIEGLTENTYWEGDGYLATLQVRVDPTAPVDSAIALVPLVDFFAYGFDTVDVAPGVPFSIYVLIPPPPPSATQWESVLSHGLLGEIPLEITPDGNFSEPRLGMRKIVVSFDSPILPETAVPANVELAGRNVNQELLDLSGITIGVTPTAANTKMKITFTPPLRDFARYRVTLNGVAGPGGHVANGRERVFTALLGDVNQNRKVQANDVGGIRGLVTVPASNVNPAVPIHVRSDVNLDARITGQDVGGLRPQVTNDATGIADP